MANRKRPIRVRKQLKILMSDSSIPRCYEHATRDFFYTV